MQELTKTVAKQEDFVVSGVEEVRKRIYEAEQETSLTEKEYRKLIDGFFQEMLEEKRKCS